MKKKSGMVSFRDIDKIIGKPEASNIVTFAWADDPEVVIEVEVKKYITLDEMREMVNAVVDNMFDAAGGYHPEIYAQAYALQLVYYFTNLKLDYSEDGTVTPRMMARLCELMYGDCDAIHTIRGAISSNQLYDIEVAIEENAHYRVRMAEAEKNAAYNQLIARLDAATETMTNFTATMNSVDAEEMVAAIRNVSKMDERDMTRVVVDTLVERGTIGNAV